MALAPPVALAAIAVLLTARGISDGDFRYSDASRHAMDGVFIHDFVRDLPESLYHPLDYAIRYYAHYPALGVVLYYPPFFAMVEAAFFAIFGISVFTAHLTVVAFAVLAVVMAYKLVSRIAGRRVAFLGAALFISLPTVVFWSRQVMLEMPTTAMILVATYFFYKYTELGRPRDAVWTALTTVAAMMTKQPAMFIVPAFGVYLLVRRRWDLLRCWGFWVGAGSTTVILVSYVIVLVRYSHYYSVAHVGQGFAHKLETTVAAWLAFAGVLLIVAVIGAAVACLVWEWRRPQAPGLWLLAIVAVVFFAGSVYAGARVPRYAMPVIPLVVCFVPEVLRRMHVLARLPVFVAVAAGVLALAAVSFAQPVPIVRGYRDAAASILAHNGDKPFFLFDGVRDGDIIFYTRQMDPSRRLYALRGSKMLYTFASMKQFGYQELVTTREELIRFIRDYGIRVVAVEDRDLADTQPGKVLREALRDPALFECAGAIPVRAPGTRLDNLTVLVYVSRSNGKPSQEFLTIPLPGLQRTITVPIDGKGAPKIVHAPWKSAP